MYVVYMHVNKFNNKKYIGMTSDTEVRWRNDGIAYKPDKGSNQNRPFWNAIQKYGFEGFEQVILKEGLTFEEACEVEKYYIKKLKTRKKRNGYNLAEGGNGGRIYIEHPRGMLGRSQTVYQRTNHSKWASNPENNCMTNGDVVWGVTHEHPKGMKGKKHNEKTKRVISETLKSNPPYKKPCYAVYPDGTRKRFETANELCRYLNISSTSSSIYIGMKKQPYKVKRGSSTKRYDLEGIYIEFEEQQS